MLTIPCRRWCGAYRAFRNQGPTAVIKCRTEPGFPLQVVTYSRTAMALRMAQTLQPQVSLKKTGASSASILVTPAIMPSSARSRSRRQATQMAA